MRRTGDTNNGEALRGGDQYLPRILIQVRGPRVFLVQVIKHLEAKTKRPSHNIVGECGPFVTGDALNINVVLNVHLVPAFSGLVQLVVNPFAAPIKYLVLFYRLDDVV